MKLDPATPVADLDWITKKQSTSLTKLGLLTLGDLVTHYPHRHEDRSQFAPFPDGATDTPILLRGTLVQARYLPYGGWKKGFEATLEEPTGLRARVTLRWFNMPYIGKQLATGQTLVAYGKAKLRGKKTLIDFPEYEIIEEDADPDLIHFHRIVPVHPAGEGLTPKKLRELIHQALEVTDLEKISGILPNPKSKIENRKSIHFPESPATLETARHAIVAEEFFAIQALIAARRAKVAALPGSAKSPPGALLKSLLTNLPFAPTAAQKRAIAEIRADLAKPIRMTRLLQGDVGSGKTLVAIAAALTTIESGHQAILMAPTQILAEQHYLNLTKLLTPLGVTTALRMGMGMSMNMGTAPVPGAGDGVPPSRIPPSAPPPTETRYSRRNLPHFERPWAKYMITFSAIPRRPLAPTSRQLVLDAILHLQSVGSWHLYAACVMPDHVHLLAEPQVKEDDPEGRPIFHRLSTLLHSVKSFAAHEINRLDGKKGPLWQKESYDRIIRSEADLQEKFAYICRNPWAANLVDEHTDYPTVWWPEKDLETARFPPPALRRDAEARTRDARAPQLLIGTHALLHDPAELADPGLVIIDEQHKFGVLQRAKLIEGPGAPDVLVMTATPIPRTLAQTAYGDLDVTTLDELPPGRGKIITGIRSAKKLPEAVKFLREQIERGRQIYIVYPLVEESDKLPAKAATAEFERWQPLLAPHACGLLHGRLKPEEKESVMTAFRSGETKALISTTVIEVGVDVPNATVMLIENAERFGLAQLHQLRGRIGRGKHTSYCILVPGKDTEEAREKLGILEETTDGFRVAEADLQLRGPGDLIGTAQTGLPPLRLGDILRDHDQMLEARTLAQTIFAEDPDLLDPAHANLKAWLATQNQALPAA